MARRYTAEEKGKSATGNLTAQPRIRISAPDFDPAELIRENSCTLVGRLTNPKEQRMSSVLSYLAKKWGVESASGSDLGRDCFQFRLNSEKEILEILYNRPYQYGRWMIIVQRWEPIISPNFPSQIPFWITIKGIPLYYWHEKVVRNIGIELGELETYVVTRTTARIRIVVDGLKPIPMEPTLAFDTGEESPITLEYESLGNHCTSCFRLSHLQSQCPERIGATVHFQHEPQMSAPQREYHAQASKRPIAKEQREKTMVQEPFRERVDRHGRPFGDRAAYVGPRPNGPKNKIAPAAPLSQRDNLREKRISPADTRLQTRHSPPLSQRRNTYRDTDLEDTHRSPKRYSPRLQWKPKASELALNSTPQQSKNNSPLLSLERHLNFNEFPPLQSSRREDGGNDHTSHVSPRMQWKATSPVAEQGATPQSRPYSPPYRGIDTYEGPNFNAQNQGIPTREAVLEELNEAALQYVNVEDPIERAARQKRVLQSEIDGSVEQTAARIIQVATANALRTVEATSTEVIILPPVTAAPEDVPTQPPRKRGRPAGTNTARTISRNTVRLSPKTYAGTGSRKRNLAKAQARGSSLLSPTGEA
ncbi:Uncharacterized protein Rs2_41947 [Raphanus sativus]|nr:Uncharacterized protein Rs2_41947 [Raphanus sativus]